MHFSIFTAVAAATFAFTLSAQASDLVDTAIAAGNLKIFVAAVKTAGFTEFLKNAGPYTVFAPSDSAFSKLPPGTWDALVKDKVKLKKVLSYHVIPGKILVSEIKPGKTKTLQGGLLDVKSDNGMVTVDNASVIESDIVADNGVIHAIDKITLPD